MSWPRRTRKRDGKGSGPGPGRETLRDLIGQLSPELRAEALRHSSWTDDRVGSYERLAFLGDSVLGLSVASLLHRDHPDMAAGELTKILNQVVSGSVCAEVGREMGIPEMLVAAEPEGDEGGHTPAESLLAAERPLPEVTEAMIGACFLQFGFERTSAAVALTFGPRIEKARINRTDFKSALQELLASRGETVSYEVVSTEGPPHERTYEVRAVVSGRELGRGSGRSKKSAGQSAAEAGLAALESGDDHRKVVPASDPIRGAGAVRPDRKP